MFLLLTEEKYKNFLASELFLARKKSKLTQDNVADILVNKYRIRANRTTIAKYENGLQTPPLYTYNVCPTSIIVKLLIFFIILITIKITLRMAENISPQKKEKFVKANR